MCGDSRSSHRSTLFPIVTVEGTRVSAVAAFSGDSFTTTTACHSTVVTRATALGAMRHGKFSLFLSDLEHFLAKRPQSAIQCLVNGGNRRSGVLGSSLRSD